MPNSRQDRSPSIVQFFKSLYIGNRFFIALAICVVACFLCFLFSFSVFIILAMLGAVLILLIIDAIAIYSIQQGIEAFRICPDRLSNGDKNPIAVTVVNNYPYKINIRLIEEVPYQFQKRDLIFDTSLISGQKDTFYYDVRPIVRGIYLFGAINIFVNSTFGLISRRYIFPTHKYVAVYPSFIEMRKYELLAASHRLTDYGIKKIRRVGHATEFDHIKHYIVGDDPRTINYKATARANNVMVNAYQEEKSQQVYCIIDKGRTMRMPFNEMTLLDYAINSTLMVSTTALNKGDKVGIITFSKDVDTILPADRARRQRNQILETLYGQRTDFKEPDYERLYVTVRRKLTQRSLIILYTNFETVNGMHRQLKYLSHLAKDHLVLVAFFLNSEFNEILDSAPNDIENIFRKGLAEKLSNDKFLIVKELNRNKIHTILTKPESLTVDSINKYLEFKARGLI